MRFLLGAAAILCLGLCLVAPFLHLFGRLDEAAFKQVLTWASLGWFVFATFWVSRRKTS